MRHPEMQYPISEPMTEPRHHTAELLLHDPESIGALHEVLTQWSDEKDIWHLARLALHEWTANLIQHATFGPRLPRLRLRIQQTDRHIEAVAEDNSAGFDLDAVPEASYEEFPERGMGLTLLRSCTERLEYAREVGQNCLRFAIASAADTTWMC